MAKIKRKKSKAKTSRRRRHGPSTWNRFVKSHAGKGHSMKTLGAMYRKAGHGKSKVARKGRRRKSDSLRVGKGVSSYAAKFRKDLQDELVIQGLSLASAKKKVSEYLMSRVGMNEMNDLASAYDTSDWRTKAEEAAVKAKRAKAARKRNELMREAVQGLKVVEKNIRKTESKAEKDARKADRLAKAKKAIADVGSLSTSLP